MRRIQVIAFIANMGEGGAQKIVLDNALWMNNDTNISFHICAINKLNQFSNYEKELFEKRIKIKYILTPFKEKLFKFLLINKLFPKYKKKYIIKQCAKFIKHCKADIVHVHLSGTMEYLVPAIKKTEPLIKFYTLHSNPYRQTGVVLDSIRNGFIKNSFIAICLNNLQYNQAKELYSISKYEILRNGINFEDIRNKKISKNDARKLLNLDNDDFVISCVGRLAPIKNYPLMLNILKNLSIRKKNIKLVIAGGGNELKELKKYTNSLGLENKVYFLGNIKNVIPVYCASDVFCLPSISEASPLVLLEAQALNSYCVISDGVPSETIVTNKVFQMNNNASIDEWCDAILNSNFHGKAICSEQECDVNFACEKLKSIYMKYYKEIFDEKK